MYPTVTPVPLPAFDDDDAPLPESELLVAPIPAGRDVTLRFASPFEVFLTLDGRRVATHDDEDERRLLIWAHRRLPVLYGALEERLGVRAVLTSDHIVVTDVIDLQEPAFLDHARARQLLASTDVALLSPAVLGSVTGKGELRDRLRAMYAVGTALEVRAEEEGRVTSRRRLRVGRD